MVECACDTHYSDLLWSKEMMLGERGIIRCYADDKKACIKEVRLWRYRAYKREMPVWYRIYVNGCFRV